MGNNSDVIILYHSYPLLIVTVIVDSVRTHGSYKVNETFYGYITYQLLINKEGIDSYEPLQLQEHMIC